MKRNEGELKKRAACQRENCRWWQYTWPLHKEYYGKTNRIMCPYRSSANRFAFDVDDEFLTLNDTTVIFLERSPLPVSAYAIEAMLNSKLLTFRYRGIGKLTGQNSWEYFDYGLARLPIKLPASNREKSICSRLEKLAMAAHDIRRERAQLIAEIDVLICEYYNVTEEDRKIIDSEMEWTAFGTAV